MNLRLVVSGSAPKPELAERPLAPGPARPRGETVIHLDGAERRAGLHDRAALSPGQHFAGPAIVAQDDCTSIVPPGFAARVDGWGNLVIEPEEA